MELACFEDGLRQVLGEPMEVEAKVVDDIPFERSGKRPFLKRLVG